MFPIAPAIVAISFGVMCFAGAVLGVASGLLSALIWRLNLRGAWKDAVLGAIAIPVGFLLVFITPWPENTVRTTFGDGRYVDTTMHQFQHPFAVAFVLAATLPVLRQLFRRKQLARRPASASD